MNTKQIRIRGIRSDIIYERMLQANDMEKENLYRYELMKPFEAKWNCIGIPLKAEAEGGFDVVAMNVMGGGYHPLQITEEVMEPISLIKDDSFWNACEDSIRNTLEGFPKKRN